MDEVELLDTLPLEAGDGKQGQQQTISAPPLDPSPISCLPSSPLGLICDDQETHELSPPEVDTKQSALTELPSEL